MEPKKDTQKIHKEHKKLGKPKTLNKAQLEKLVERDRLHYHITEGDSARRLNVSDLLAEPFRAGLVYCCGPQELIDAVGRAASSWRRNTVIFEHFKPEPLDGMDEPFDVKIASTGQVIPIGPKETVLAALWKAGIKRDFSCEMGICRTCVIQYCDGTPNHRDQVLSGEERKHEIAICISRCKSPVLTLDI